MTDVLTVPTAFENLQQLGEGLVDRIDSERIILYGPQGYPEGQRIGFTLLLADGSVALEGNGVVLASVDGGEERGEPFRFDVVLGELRFDARHEVVFERLLLARSGGGEPTGQVDLERLEEAEPSPLEPEDEPPFPEAMETRVGAPQELADAEVEPADEPPFLDAMAPVDEEPLPAGAERTVVASLDEMQEVQEEPEPQHLQAPAEPAEPPPAEPAEPPPAEPAEPPPAVRPAPERPVEPSPFPLPDAGRVLTRPSRHVAWTPHAPPRPGPGEPDPRFPSDASLPAPQELPRLALAPERRIEPPPHPSRPNRPSLAGASAALALAAEPTPDATEAAPLEAPLEPPPAPSGPPEPPEVPTELEASGELPLELADVEPLSGPPAFAPPEESTALDVELPDEE